MLNTTKPKREISPEARQKMLDNLAAARAIKAELKRAGKLVVRPRATIRQDKATPARFDPSFALWSEERWATVPYDEAVRRLQLLHQDHEIGSRILGTRPSQGPLTYKCIVCRRQVRDGDWSSKQDYRDDITGLFGSYVTCRANGNECFERFREKRQFYLDRYRAERSASMKIQ